MFLDEAIISVKGGNGGNGCVAWRREKYVAKGGPAGGDGGQGGDMYFQANANTDTLSDYASCKRFQAENGKAGSGSRKTGRSGEDLVLDVPPGTMVVQLDSSGDEMGFIGDLQEHGDLLKIADGGRGGFGNAHFKSSVRQRPDFAEKGEKGEEKRLRLELKLVADVGIIGFPSVGKSTLIAAISAAKPKIAEYHFTTLVPNLGVVDVDDRSYVVCDVPGLIEGASEGKGLGGTFLKHIERCGLLLHVLDLSKALQEGGKIDTDALISDYQAIRKELTAYSPTLAHKREIVLLNKYDLLGDQNIEHVLAVLHKHNIPVEWVLSAATRSGTQQLTKDLLPIVLEEREKRKQAELEQMEDIPVLRPQEASEKMGAYRVERRENGVYVFGTRLEQFTAMTDFENHGGVKRLRDVLERIGVLKAIRREREDESLPVYIGDKRIDSYVPELSDEETEIVEDADLSS